MQISNYAIDVECLDIESTAVILSVGVIPFELANRAYTFDELVASAFFVKFDVAEQVQRYKRTISQKTMEWWGEQSAEVRTISFNPHYSDVKALDGVNAVASFITKTGKPVLWQRGILDRSTLDSLCRALGRYSLAGGNWMEFRTAISLLSPNATNGYTAVENFDPVVVTKHNPVHDCAYDILQLLHPVM